MSFFDVTPHARQSQASPSVSLERGAYRMRAPPPPRRSGLSLLSSSPPRSRAGLPASPRRRRGSAALSRDGFPVALQRERRLAMLLVVLVCGAVSCFGVAYYLFTTGCVCVFPFL